VRNDLDFGDGDDDGLEPAHTVERRDVVDERTFATWEEFEELGLDDRIEYVRPRRPAKEGR